MVLPGSEIDNSVLVVSYEVTKLYSESLYLLSEFHTTSFKQVENK